MGCLATPPFWRPQRPHLDRSRRFPRLLTRSDSFRFISFRFVSLSRARACASSSSQFFVKAKVVRKSEAVKKVKKLAALAEMVSYLSDTILAGKPKSPSLSPSLSLSLSVSLPFL